MKIIENFDTMSAADLVKLAGEEGIAASRLDGAFGSTYLPEKGKFVSVAFDGYKAGETQPDGTAAKDNTKHLVLVTESGEKISIGRLQASGFVGAIDEEKDVIESSKGTFYLRSNTTPNPALGGNQILAAKKLVGKMFVASPVELTRTKYVPGGYSDRKDHITAVYKTYALTNIR